MKKTLLACSVLFAFGAHAENIYIENAGLVTGNSAEWQAGQDNDRVFGGYFVDKNGSNLDKAQSEINSQVKVTGGNFNYVLGGHYVSEYDSKIEHKVASTSVVIDGDDTKVHFLAAGTAAWDTRDISNASSQSNLVIHGGTFGEEKTESNNVHELLVLGGDMMKASADTSASRSAISSIDKVNITIDGGTFHSAVVGGSAAYGHFRKFNPLTSKG